MTSAIVVDRLTRHNGTRSGIEDVSFEVGAGEVCRYLGRGGADETTTIRLPLGFLLPHAGTVRILGRDVWRESPAASTRAWRASPGPAGSATPIRRRSSPMVCSISATAPSLGSSKWHSGHSRSSCSGDATSSPWEPGSR